MSNFPIVEIVWIDAIGGSGWSDLDDILNATSTFHTQIGYLIEDNEQEIKLCSSFNQDLTNMGAFDVIPKCMIKSMRQVDKLKVVLGTMDVEKST